MRDFSPPPTQGFTLIELSLVLVIIGLIVGGVLVGRDLIAAAEVRAQVSQIEKYHQAVNTFRGKYGYLPGDIPGPSALQFGFQPRGTYEGEGDGNGVLEGVYAHGAGYSGGVYPLIGEMALFWRDLSFVQLVDGSFTLASATTGGGSITPSTSPSVSRYLPPAKIGNGNYVYVWSGGVGHVNGAAGFDGANYFGLSKIWSMDAANFNSAQGMTVAQAYAIDKKIDDGMPQGGNVQAWYLDRSKSVSYVVWAISGGGRGDSAPSGGPVISSASVSAPTQNSCYDGGTAPDYVIPEQYSMTQNNGTGVNCALSFKFQ